MRRRAGAARLLTMVLTLPGLLQPFASVDALESRPSRNVADTAQARYLAEAGIEVGFTVLINTPDFSAALAGASASVPWVPVVSKAALSGEPTGGKTAEGGPDGTYTVVIRNDYQNADAALTGQSSGTDTIPNETPTRDGNQIVIMRATGAFNGVIKTIDVVVRRQQPPPLPGIVDTSRLHDTISLELDGHHHVGTGDVGLERRRAFVSGDFHPPAAD